MAFYGSDGSGIVEEKEVELLTVIAKKAACNGSNGNVSTRTHPINDMNIGSGRRDHNECEQAGKEGKLVTTTSKCPNGSNVHCNYWQSNILKLYTKTNCYTVASVIRSIGRRSIDL